MACVPDQFQHLLSPGRIGSVAIRNRIVLPAMDQNNCDDGLVTDRTIAHYEARARGGAGLLILETSAVAYPYGSTSRHQPALSHDGVVDGLRRLADAVHAHGARMVVQACHHGKVSSLDTAEGRPVLVPSVPIPPIDRQAMLLDTTVDELMAMATMTGGKFPDHEEASVERLERVVSCFTDAAARIQAAGMDGIEVHAAHGYLISTFLSPAWNRRTDAYGGTTVGRAKLLVDVVASIRKRCGPDFALIVRLDGNEYGVQDGTTPELAAEYARLAVAAGADAIHVSAHSSAGSGVGFTDGPLPWQSCQYEGFARTVKAAVDVPVIAVGRIQPADAERIIGSGGSDFVSMGRQLLADPDMPARLTEGRPDLVRPCINCFVCVAQNFWNGRPVCAVNAQLGSDLPEPETADRQRHLVVVGGGPAGLECARTAAGRGHRVTLLEKESRLGGTAWFSSLTTPLNGDLVSYLEASLHELGVDVRCGVTADEATVADLEPDVLVVATGARRIRPDVPGSDMPHVLSGDDLRSLLTGGGDRGERTPGPGTRILLAAGRALGLTSDMGRIRSLSRIWMPVGRSVVVIGGGLVGTELAEFLAERGRSVTVLEEGQDLAPEMAHPRRWRALHEARRHGVAFHTGAVPTSITERRVTYRIGTVDHEVAADTVLLAAGVHTDRSLVERLRGTCGEIHVIGDADKVGYIEGAVRSGHLIGRTI